jgi:hypothetical protein
VRITDLQPGTPYKYVVTQGAETHAATLRTAPADDQPNFSGQFGIPL